MRDYFTEDFDAEAYLKELQEGTRQGRNDANWIIKKGGLAVFMPIEIWHFARNMGHSSCILDYGVEMHRLGSGRGYWSYLFVIIANKQNEYVKCGAINPIQRVGMLSLDQYADDHEARQRVLQEETNAFRRLWTEEMIARRWPRNPNYELQKVYYFHWTAEYRRMKEDAKRGGWKLDYDMPI